MDLQTLKKVIESYPEYRGQKHILKAFNEEGQQNGLDSRRRVSLDTAARILGGGTDNPVLTYHQHVRFAKRHGLQSFTYRSKKTGRMQTYQLEGNQYRQV